MMTAEELERVREAVKMQERQRRERCQEQLLAIERVIDERLGHGALHFTILVRDYPDVGLHAITDLVGAYSKILHGDRCVGSVTLTCPWGDSLSLRDLPSYEFLFTMQGRD